MKKLYIIVIFVFLFLGIKAQNYPYSCTYTATKDTSIIIVNNQSMAGFNWYADFDWTGFSITTTYITPKHGYSTLGPIGLARSGSATDTIKLSTTAGHRSCSGKVDVDGKVVIVVSVLTNASVTFTCSWGLKKF
jgi:hypothetical protein